MGVEITDMDAADLIGHLITNEHGLEYVVIGLSLQAATGQIIIRLEAFAEGELLGVETNVPHLDGFTIHHRVRTDD